MRIKVVQSRLEHLNFEHCTRASYAFKLQATNIENLVKF